MRRRTGCSNGIPVAVTVAAADLSGHDGILALDHALTLDEVDEHRRDKCPYYDKCLCHASNMQWRSFSCKFCDGTTNLK
jgi:hypothetical protein